MEVLGLNINHVLIVAITLLASALSYKFYIKKGWKELQYLSIAILVSSFFIAFYLFVGVPQLSLGSVEPPQAYYELNDGAKDTFNFLTFGAYNSVFSTLKDSSGTPAGLVAGSIGVLSIVPIALRYIGVYGTLKLLIGDKVSERVGGTHLASLAVLGAVSLLLTVGLSYTLMKSPQDIGGKMEDSYSSFSSTLGSGDLVESGVTSFGVSEALYNTIEGVSKTPNSISDSSAISSAPLDITSIVDISMMVSFVITIIAIVIGVLIFTFLVREMFPDVNPGFPSAIVVVCGLTAVGLSVKIATTLIFIITSLWFVVLYKKYGPDRTEFIGILSIVLLGSVLVTSSISLPRNVLFLLESTIIFTSIFIASYIVSITVKYAHSFWVASRRGGTMRVPESKIKQSYSPVRPLFLSFMITLLVIVGISLYGVLIGVGWSTVIVLSISGLLSKSELFRKSEETQKAFAKDVKEAVK